jgi:hypothetical protein
MIGCETPFGDQSLAHDLGKRVEGAGVVLDIEHEDDVGFFIRDPRPRLRRNLLLEDLPLGTLTAKA